MLNKDGGDGYGTMRDLIAVWCLMECQVRSIYPGTGAGTSL